MQAFHARPGEHLVLVGLPAAGKTSVGVALSHRLRWPFVDFDAEIARRTSRSIAEIFEVEGEEVFRQMELELTREFIGARASVLSPGGGWIVNDGAMALLRPPARIIHLQVSTTCAVRRIRRSPNVRPLLATPDPQATMDRLWRERAPLYATADFVINAEGLDTKRVTDQIVALAARDASGLG
jgi:shikimate kinase